MKLAASLGRDHKVLAIGAPGECLANSPEFLPSLTCPRGRLPDPHFARGGSGAEVGAAGRPGELGDSRVAPFEGNGRFQGYIPNYH